MMSIEESEEWKMSVEEKKEYTHISNEKRGVFLCNGKRC